MPEIQSEVFQHRLRIIKTHRNIIAMAGGATALIDVFAAVDSIFLIENILPLVLFTQWLVVVIVIHIERNATSFSSKATTHEEFAVGTLSFHIRYKGIGAAVDQLAGLSL